MNLFFMLRDTLGFLIVCMNVMMDIMKCFILEGSLFFCLGCVFIFMKNLIFELWFVFVMVFTVFFMGIFKRFDIFTYYRFLVFGGDLVFVGDYGSYLRCFFLLLVFRVDYFSIWLVFSRDFIFVFLVLVFVFGIFSF